MSTRDCPRPSVDQISAVLSALPVGGYRLEGRAADTAGNTTTASFAITIG